MTNPIITLSLLVILVACSEQARPQRRSYRPLHSDKCVTGNGEDYRGRAHSTFRGRECSDWNRVVNIYASRYYGTGVGAHNYCRNPNGGKAPWCYVYSSQRYVKEYCSIPICKPPKPTTTTTTTTPTTTPTTTTTTTTTTPEPAQRDTEFTCGERTAAGGDGRRFKIVGGAYTAVSSHPWIAAVYMRSRRSGDYDFKCGGTLIAPCWVLSAAHCFKDGERTLRPSKIRVYLGKSATKRMDVELEQSFRVTQVIVHEDYIGQTPEGEQDYNNDIALLRIEGEGGECALRTETVRTACLAPAHTMLPPGSTCTVAGYGKDHPHTAFFTNILKEGQVILRTPEQCRAEATVSRMTDNMFCAASHDWKTDACQGDSGGPLVCDVQGRMFLFGVVSFGDKCAEEGKPGYYTRVTNYNKWIAKSTGLPSYTQGSMYPQK